MHDLVSHKYLSAILGSFTAESSIILCQSGEWSAPGGLHVGNDLLPDDGYDAV